VYKTLWFSHTAYQELLRLASEAADGRETGGLMFGYTVVGNQEAVITDVSGPEPDSGRTHYLFTPGDKATKQARDRFIRGGLWEIGGWHTHPPTHPEPSQGDEAAARIMREWAGWHISRPCIEAIVLVPEGGLPKRVGAWYFTKTEKFALEVRVATESWKPPFDSDGNFVQVSEEVQTA
jgi:integrative and conjugative element protein (TIGR02256 family)